MYLDYNREAFKKLCRKYNVSLAILHGSYARGCITKDSDIDVGLLVEQAVLKEKYLKMLSDFSSIFGDKFDPVFLNGAEAMITQRVAVNGIPLYEKKKGLFNSFKVAAIARYIDTKKFRVLEKKYIRQAIQR